MTSYISPQNPEISIGIVDDHNLVRIGIEKIINAVPEFKVTLSSQSGMEFLTLLEQNVSPNIVIIDVHMPELSGFELAEIISHSFPDIKILAMSFSDDFRTITRMIEMGSIGYVLKDCNVSDLHEAIYSIYNDKEYLPAQVSTIIKDTSKTSLIKLTDNQGTFLRHCCSHMTYKEIGLEMHLSERTIHGYRDRLFKKFDVRRRSELINIAHKLKLLR